MKFIKSFLFFLITGCFSLQAQNDKPALVVGIVVEGWQQKHIDLLWNYFESDGIRKLTSQGAT